MGIRICSVLLIGVLSTTFSVATMQHADTLESMKLLTAQAGWAATNGHLFWTTDGGATWNDITPKTSDSENLVSVFFSNTSTGWALLSSFDETKDEPRFDFASTANAGTSWSITSIRFSGMHKSNLSGSGWVDFVDSLHGWVILRQASSSAFSTGVMLKTDDGGRTWSLTSGALPIADPFRFVTTKDGWMARLGGVELYATHDGGNTWREVLLNAPKQVRPAVYATYSLPTFEDRRHGYLSVTYSRPSCGGSALVLFETHDGGNNWRVNRVLPNLDATSLGQTIPNTVVDSNFKSVIVSSSTGITLVGVSADGNVTHANAEVASAGAAVLDLSFSSNMRGWVLTSGGLMLTTDGGDHWVDVTPNMTPGIAVTQSKSRVEQSAQHAKATNPRAGAVPDKLPAVRNSLNAKLGLSQQFVACAKPQMSAWWKDSPYFDVGFYLNAKQGDRTFPYQKKMNHKYDGNLDSTTWIAPVRTQGWSLYPTWIGLQAPAPPQGPFCTPEGKFSTFSLDTMEAENQGINEATLAAASASALRLSGTVIYKDIEHYETRVNSCSLAVRAFLKGWIDTLHAKGFKAGVYGNPLPAQQDFSQVSPLPDDVWIAKYDNRVTIWGLAQLCDPFSKRACMPRFWVNGQRIHQYQENVNESHGGYTFDGIDLDIVDADVVPPSGNSKIVKASNALGSRSGKSYTFDYTNIDVGLDTNPYSINASGQIVGLYLVGDHWHGFLYTNGSPTALDYPGASDTLPLAINNAGQVVGEYSLDGYSRIGFLVSPPYRDQNYKSISLGNNIWTDARGIDDAGLISGNYQDGGWRGFLMNTNTGKITSFAYDDRTTFGEGINGDALLAGATNDTGFLYNAVTSIFTPLSFNAVGVNNNVEIAGNDSSGGVLYDYASGTETRISPPGATFTYVYGLNDYAQVVGYYYDSSNSFHGFLATPKQR